MVIDTSAIVAILFDEPEREEFNHKIAAATHRLLSAPTLVECSLILESRKQALGGTRAIRLHSRTEHRAV